MRLSISAKVALNATNGTGDIFFNFDILCFVEWGFMMCNRNY